MLRARGRAPTSYSFVVFILDSHLSLLRRLGACHWNLFNEKWDGMVQWVKVAKKEKDTLEISKMLQTCNIFVEDDLIF